MFLPTASALERYFVVAGTLISLCGAGCALFPRHHLLLSAGTLVIGFCFGLSPIAFDYALT